MPVMTTPAPHRRVLLVGRLEDLDRPQVRTSIASGFYVQQVHPLANVNGHTFDVAVIRRDIYEEHREWVNASVRTRLRAPEEMHIVPGKRPWPG